MTRQTSRRLVHGTAFQTQTLVDADAVWASVRCPSGTVLLLLLLVACWPLPCESFIGLTREEARARLRDIPGDTGRHTFTESGDTLYVRIDHIPDDSVSARDLRLRFSPDATGRPRVAACAARQECARGWGVGMCP